MHFLHLFVYIHKRHRVHACIELFLTYIFVKYLGFRMIKAYVSQVIHYYFYAKRKHFEFIFAEIEIESFRRSDRALILSFMHYKINLELFFGIIIFF